FPRQKRMEQAPLFALSWSRQRVLRHLCWHPSRRSRKLELSGQGHPIELVLRRQLQLQADSIGSAKRGCRGGTRPPPSSRVVPYQVASIQLLRYQIKEWKPRAEGVHL